MSHTSVHSQGGAGEPAEPLVPPRKVVEEVAWGSNFQKRRKTLNRTILKPKSAPARGLRAGDAKVMVWRPQSMQNVNVTHLFDALLMDGSKVVDRNGLTPKQHIKLLAAPKKRMFDTHGKELVKQIPRGCTPRIVQLAAPNKRRVLGTWKDYQNTLPIMKIDKLIGILNADIALDLPDAEQCFRDLARRERLTHRRLDRKAKRSVLRQKRIERRWIEMKAIIFATIVAKYLFNSHLLHLNHFQKELSDQILSCLDMAGKLVRPSRSTKSVYKQGLLASADQCAVFAYNALAIVDAFTEASVTSLASSGEFAGSSELSTTDEDKFPSIQEELRSSLDHESLIEQMFEKIDNSANLDEAEVRLLKLVEILRAYYEVREDIHGLRIFSDLTLPGVTLEGVIEDINMILTLKSESEPVSRLQRALQRKITAWVEEIDPDSLDGTMREVICFVSHELAMRMMGIGKGFVVLETVPEEEDDVEIFEVDDEIDRLERERQLALEEEMRLELVAAQEAEEAAERAAAEAAEREAMEREIAAREEAEREAAEHEAQEAADREAAELARLAAEAEEIQEAELVEEIEEAPESIEEMEAEIETAIEEEVDELEGLDGMGLVDAQALDVLYEVEIMPHAPDMVCCASLKVWATWVKDVAENAKNWCVWINQTIKQMRAMAAVIRGEVEDDEGNPITLKREDWNAFVLKLDKDIVAWRHYNQHVQELTEKITSHYQDKRVGCCTLCEQENIELSELGAEHLCEQLFEALQTTQYWRKWLHSMVLEAESLTGLVDNQDIATIMEVTSSTEMLAMAGASIVAPQAAPRSVAGPSLQYRKEEPSVYSIERVDSPQSQP